VSGAENGVERAENRVTLQETLEWERIVALDAVQRMRTSGAENMAESVAQSPFIPNIIAIVGRRRSDSTPALLT